LTIPIEIGTEALFLILMSFLPATFLEAGPPRAGSAAPY
jgi:hypothetical protein